MQVTLEPEIKERLTELRKLAFDTEWAMNPVDSSTRSERHGSMVMSPVTSGLPPSSQEQDDFAKLGFTNGKNPMRDFNVSPPGLLGLDLMLYLAKNYTELYVKVVLENCCRSDREHECPFTRSSTQVSKLLAEILAIGESPSDEGKHFYPVFYD